MTPTDSAMTAEAKMPIEQQLLIEAFKLRYGDKGHYEATALIGLLESAGLELVSRSERTKLAADLARVTRMHDQAFRAGIHHQERAEALQADLARLTSQRTDLVNDNLRLEADLARVEGERDQLSRDGHKALDIVEARALREEQRALAAEAKSARLVEALESAEQLKRPIFDFFNGHQPEGDHGFNREWGVAADAANKLHEVLATLTLLERADSLTGERKP